MAWTINNGKLYFNTKLYTGNGASSHAITGVGFKPDWTWNKNRSSAVNHALTDVVRAAPKRLVSNNTEAEINQTTGLLSFNSDGFTVGSDSGYNGNGNSMVSWNWIAAGANPAKTYVVKVVSDGGNKYRFDDFGTSAVTLELSEGGTFTFDQSDSSNSNHPLRFSTTSNGTHGGGSEYTTGVTTNGTPGNAGAYTRITVAASAPTLYYYCTNHSNMGGQANTPVTNSFSNFAGTIQSNISPNTTSGFSIVKWTGTGSAGTIGHGLGSAPLIVLFKSISGSSNWYFYTYQIDGSSDELALNLTEGKTDRSLTAPTSSLFYVDGQSERNGSGATQLAYCFAEKQGYSKFGSYKGNGNADGAFIYTGFKPAWIMIKATSQNGEGWFMFDNKRDVDNAVDKHLTANLNNAEGSGSHGMDFVSNGIKIRNGGDGTNTSGGTYIYMAFAENPFTSSAGTPVTAR